MSKGSTGEARVVEFRCAIQELLRSRIQEAIQITVEEELAEALGCGPYERNGSRRGYRHVDEHGESLPGARSRGG